MIDLVPLGDRAFLARFGIEAEARAWASAANVAKVEGAGEIVLAYRSAAVYADDSCDDIDALGLRLRAIVPGQKSEESGSLINLPVYYDGNDLREVADRLGLTASQVVEAHAGRVYDVFALGFLPGFPYAGYLPDAIAGLPRRQSPRTRVPAGSVAIAGRQTGVYPGESPGGWHLIGRTPLRIVDVKAGHFPIRAGDRLQFLPIGPGEFADRRGEFL